MIKKILAFLLSVFIASTVVYPAFAADDQNQQQLSPMLRGLMASNTNGDMSLLTTRSNYGYMQFAANFRSNAMSQYLIQMTDKLIDTGYEPDEAEYIKALSNIILTYDFNNAADISYQAQLDDLKGFKDYVMDAKDATVDIVGILAGNSGFEEALTTAIDGMSVLIDSTDNWLEALYDLDTVLQDYSFYEFFLEAVEENSDGTLKSAASKMKDSLSSILQIRLESYADTSKDNFVEFGEFFITDIFIEVLKNTSEYQNDEAIRFFTDEAGEVINNIDVLSASWDLGMLIGKTIGNVVVGGENLVNRVLEIEALYDISCALQTKLLSTCQEALTDFSDEKAEQTVHLAQILIDCRIRGEYCEYSILASDAGLLSWAGKDSAEDALEWYERQTTALLAMEKRFVTILTLGIITGTAYTTESDGTLTALSNATVTVADTEGNTVESVVTADSSGYSFLLTAGTYTITAELDGYETVSKEITLAENDVLNVDFEMETNKQAESAEYEIVRQDRSYYNENGDTIIEMYYDQVVLSSGGATYDAINQVITNDYETFLSDTIVAEAIEAVESYPYTITADAPFYDIAEADVTQNGDGILSIRIETYWMMGGVGNVDQYGLTFDLVNGQALGLADLFPSINQETLLEFIEDVLQLYVAENDYGWYDDAPYTIDSYTLDTFSSGYDQYHASFYIRNGEVILCIPTYDLAPGASGSFEVSTGLYLGNNETLTEVDTEKTTANESLIESIRKNYYGIEYSLDSFSVIDGDGGLTYYLDDSGTIRKIVAPAGFYDSDIYAGADRYSAEFYYGTDGGLSFVFVFCGSEEYRFYISNGRCIRYIDQNGEIIDYEVNGVYFNDVSPLEYFCTLGQMELHYAGAW